jgi:hypothetical protein
MTPQTKAKIGVAGMGIISLAIVAYTSIVIAEHYVAYNGRIVMAEVVGTSELCRYKRKYIQLRVEDKIEDLRIYGRRCRRDEFPKGKFIEVRKNDWSGIVVIPGNQQVARIIYFPFFMLLVIVVFILVVRDYRKKKQAGFTSDN